MTKKKCRNAVDDVLNSFTGAFKEPYPSGGINMESKFYLFRTWSNG
jgi:hypothetical protein